MLNDKQFKSAVNTIQKTGEKIDGLIHQAACFAVFHSIKDGQISPAVSLVAAMPKSGRRSNLISWLCLYGNLTYVAGVLKACSHHGAKHKQGTPEREIIAFAQHDSAEANPFWEEFSDAVVVLKPFDFDAALIKLLHQAKIVQAGQSEKYSGLEQSKFLQQARDFIPGDLLQKIDTIKDNGKSKDLIPKQEA